MLKCPFLLLLAACAMLPAQTAPCGRNIVTVGGSAKEERFLPAPAEHVKACLLRALPVVAAKLSKDKGLSVEAKTDRALYASLAQQHKEGGVGSFWSFERSLNARPVGTFYVSMEPSSENSITGTRLRIEFQKSVMKSSLRATSQAATPLMEEVACLAQILTPGDPLKSPRGPATAAAPVEAKTVTVPEGVTVKLLLREFLYSREIKKQKVPGPIPFEVAEDVKLDGATVIRKGALGIGQFVSAKAARRRGKSGELQFALEEVAAVDGQMLKLTGATDRSRGSRRDGLAIVGLLDFHLKGIEALVRAGTGYEAQVATASQVQIGR